MGSTAILYPAFAMFFLTMGCLLTLGVSRHRAIRNRQVSIRYYRTFDEGTQPERLHLISRHVQNHFEVPPLFYAGIILCYITGVDSGMAVAFAWLFVVARVVHTVIHLGNNKVTQRFIAFVFSVTCLCGLWVILLIELL